jgi:CRISPR system Cascade subunit CasC
MSEFIQFHVITAYPPSNLNRDDLGRPKTAVVGGTQRLRVSSQSLKRAWRMSDTFNAALEGQVGKRTKELGQYVYEELRKKAVGEEAADVLAKRVAAVFGKSKAPADGAAKKGKKGKEEAGAGAKKAAAEREIEQLAHVSAAEFAGVDAIVARVAAGGEPSDDELGMLLTNGHGSADIALFGRMLAAAPDKNVEAAAQVAHAITVHKVTVEDDYFTAVDDLNRGDEDRGAAHIGTNEFASGVFYLYVCINRTLLAASLDGNESLVAKTLRGLGEAIATVSPSGKQNSFAARSRASYVLVERGEQQPRTLAAAFLESVEAPDVLGEAIRRLEDTRARFDQVYGPCARATAAFNVPKGDGSLKAVLDLIAQ